ncbi:hypothetical protein AMTRI_Chr03g44110 [Amborella trichopoda]|uniref:uncharacterized protein LOC110007749 n=1 Tax=Amborella trichopoda TaxID=13333 RepID=UPI0009BE9A8C|nr:uncharacterized protein LOC110007749 [Amborella trichopoda]|eukprot:XP_020526276.1 uncharacterized protein LOC110007749 [Amborella trichopoda]
MLEEWLGRKADDYWDENFDNLALKRGSTHFIPDNEWVQCDKRRKWRMLSPGFNSNSLPSEWFWCLPPFKGLRSDPEQKLKPGIVTVGAKRSHITSDNDPLYIEVSPSAIIKRKLKGEGSLKKEDTGEERPILKRIRRGPSKCRRYKKPYRLILAFLQCLEYPFFLISFSNDL